ncbi:arsenical-resistance protein ACR3 [Neofusicoccum parvum]|uniref:Arsenical-resistance protein ACR3 n=2 Tax=Neofusicoccum parvum TaxID=310453 RepID=A0ACB5RRV0_9PEZI|nr:putative arsenical-resistance protein [Neofusicoccum parvum UCRNP2]GME23183.1 arsenical-resistance protein ACR3 [Neofusicoccum parvum]GME37299.1 arsenical-resistance protein ACR3 [Neofusicoccum parvum]
MAIGILLGAFVPSTGPTLNRGTFVGVSIPIAVGLLVMMYPILIKVRYETLHLLFSHRALWKQLAVSVVLNWIIAPALMTALAWAFLPDRADLREGLIFVGVARCIAMVLVWTDLAGGDGEYCAVLVAVNSIPLAAAILTRATLLRLLGPTRYTTHFVRPIAPLSLIGLLYTIIVLFASQGAHVAHQITSVLRVAAPLVVYFVLVFGGTCWLCRRCGFVYGVSCTQSFTAASNNFELAIALPLVRSSKYRF